VVAGEDAARSKFESLYEVEEIARRRTAFDQKMQVIWHETVGVEGENREFAAVSRRSSSVELVTE